MFGIFQSVRDILQLTVFLDHPLGSTQSAYWVQTFVQQILVAYICSFQGLHQPNPCQKIKKKISRQISYHLWSYELDLSIWLSWHKYTARNNHLKKIFFSENLARFDEKCKKKISNKYYDLLIHASFTKFVVQLSYF